MTHCKIVAAVAVIAALAGAAPIATAASPPAPQRVAHAQPWLDWANSFLVPGTADGSDMLARASTYPPPSAPTTKNEISIETLELHAAYSGDAYGNGRDLRSAWSLPASQLPSDVDRRPRPPAELDGDLTRGGAWRDQHLSLRAST
jgi:hypothetical protein